MFTAILVYCENEALQAESKITIMGNINNIDDAVEALDMYLYQHGYSLNLNDYYISGKYQSDNECHYETGDSEQGLPLQYRIELK